MSQGHDVHAKLCPVPTGTTPGAALMPRLTLQRRFCSLTSWAWGAICCPAGASMGSKNGSAISRREFARRAAFVSAAAASLSPAELLAGESAAAMAPPIQAPATAAASQTPTGPKLSPESQAEMESRLQAVFVQYSSRLSDAQKSDLRRIAADGQAALDRLRAYPTDNGDGSALYLKPLMEREKKPAEPATA